MRSEPPCPLRSKIATREAAPAKIGDHLEILFDELAAALHDADRAARWPPRRLPQSANAV